MLKNVFLLLFFAFVAGSCLKSKNENSCPYALSSVTAPQSEQDSVTAYLDSNNIVATMHPSGFYYKIINPGTGADSAKLCSQILINYKGKLVNGSVFEEQNNVIFVLGSLIEGWKKGIPLVKKGGEIQLFVPPSLAYGNQDVKNGSGVVVIPAKSVLIFDVKLLDFSAGN